MHSNGLVLRFLQIMCGYFDSGFSFEFLLSPPKSTNLPSVDLFAECLSLHTRQTRHKTENNRLHRMAKVLGKYCAWHSAKPGTRVRFHASDDMAVCGECHPGGRQTYLFKYFHTKNVYRVSDIKRSASLFFSLP